MVTRLLKRTRMMLLVLLLLSDTLSTAVTSKPVVHAATAVAPPPFGNADNIMASSNTRSTAWGDVDNDGDLDLVLGNNGVSQLYRNQSGTLTLDTNWNPAGTYTTSVAWGDVDGDGDLDLVLGNYNKPSQLYRNQGGTLTLDTSWNPVKDYTTSVAWGDVDGDGALDLVLGNSDAFNDYPPAPKSSQLYKNDGRGTLTLVDAKIWNPPAANTRSVAWGDVDGDGALDLVLGNYGQPSQLYKNDGRGMLTLVDAKIWNPPVANTTSVAWGDVNGDGALDLVLGNSGQPSQLYKNDGRGKLTLVDTKTWNPPSANTQSVALGDMDGDGDLDLVLGNDGQSSQLYRGDGHTLSSTSSWSSDVTHTKSVACGDVDGDGDLDLALGNYGQSSQLYRNGSGTLTGGTTLNPAGDKKTLGVAWGDVDGDGDLDLVLGNGDFYSTTSRSSQLYTNDGHGTLTRDTTWDPAPANTTSVAWGDVDRDGDLDLVLGNYNQPSRLYRNDGPGTLTLDKAKWDPPAAPTRSVAWGDVDGDGALDLVLGNDTQPSQMYKNDGHGTLTLDKNWNPDKAYITSVAWGDVDGDGDLDLVLGNNTQTQLYRNQDGTLTRDTTWKPIPANTKSVAWGDIDGDGDLDLVLGNDGGPSQLYRNQSGTLTLDTTWNPASTKTLGVAWGDVDGDGDLDLVLGNIGQSQLYRNQSGTLTLDTTWQPTESATQSVAWGDVDGDGALDLVLGNSSNEASQLYRYPRITTGTGPAQVQLGQPAVTPLLYGANGYATATIITSAQVTVPYTLKQPTRQPVGRVIGQYSLDGGGNWRPALATADTVTTTLATSLDGTAHTFTWDTLASDVFGQSDNVMFRLIAVPDLHARPNRVPGPFLHGSGTAATLPFRLRGTQPQVFGENDKPLADAQVYRLPPSGGIKGATPVAEPRGQTFRTNHLGYLEGRGVIGLGDHLVALQEITHTAQYTMYFTSAAPTTSGLDMFTVTQPGVQKLTVSPKNPLMLLNLSVSLEWDARGDAHFMSQLKNNLQHVSSNLYNWSDGQIALGTIRIYQAKDHWDDTRDANGKVIKKGADIRIRATNNLRPNAIQGGITTQNVTETLQLTNTPSTVVYEPGHVQIGAVWNRDGSPDEREQSDDWARALTHELGHYALYLNDNYIGLDAGKKLINVPNCLGAMSNPYASDTIDFRPDRSWLPDCATTLSNRTTGRSDWATIQQFYNKVVPGFFHQPTRYTELPGPNVLPLAVTQVQFVDPNPSVSTSASTIAPYLTITGKPYDARSSARGFAFSADGRQIRDLGQPSQGQLIARGFQSDDELCVYDLAAAHLGCTNVVTAALPLGTRSDWQPDVVVTPVTSSSLVPSRTLEITVAADGVGVPAPTVLKARLFPSDTTLGAVDVDLQPVKDKYIGRFTLPDLVLEGYVRVWVDEPKPRREIVTDYAVGGNPTPRQRPRPRSYAPVISSDGQVILFTDETQFNVGEFFSLQSVTHLPPDPPTARAIGQAYRLIVSNPAPSLANVSINMAFATDDVPRGSDDWVAMYYYPEGGTQWERVSDLPGGANSNEVNAQVRGPGIYALMASLPLQLNDRGWNQIPWPGATTPLPGALTLLGGSYSHLYGYKLPDPSELKPSDTNDPWNLWKLYAPGAPSWVNEQNELVQGDLYRIYVTAPLSATLRPAAATPLQAQAPSISSLPIAPATYYATLTTTAEFTPTVDLPVVARVNGIVCGQTKTQQLDDGRVGFAIDVFAAGAGETEKCGFDGAPVTITVGNYTFPTSLQWDNTQLHPLDANLHPVHLHQIMLPLLSNWLEYR